MKADHVIDYGQHRPVIDSGYRFSVPPKPVGYWVLYAEVTPQTKFAMYHKPTDYQIYNTEQLLGWKWEDA